MIAPKEKRPLTGYTPIDLSKIKNQRKDRFTQNLALAGLNGKFIALTGTSKLKSMDREVDGKVTSTEYWSFEALFSSDATFENAKVGTVGLSILKAIIKVKGDVNYTPIIGCFKELSEEDALKVLLEDGTYLEPVEQITALIPEFVDGKPDFTNAKEQEKYLYKVGRLEPAPISEG